jgi:hypothetical protein
MRRKKKIYALNLICLDSLGKKKKEVAFLSKLILLFIKKKKKKTYFTYVLKF